MTDTVATINQEMIDALVMIHRLAGRALSEEERVGQRIRELRPDAMLSCISTAHRTAADGLANSANAPSPVVLISRPSWRERPGSITSHFSRSNSA